MSQLTTVIIPLYNESETILELLEKLHALTINIEIILVDDGSTDSSYELVKSLNHPEIRLLYHSKRTGKGAAVQTGLQAASGDIIVIQDADLEYDPNDIAPLVKMIESGQARVVYGVRDLSSQKMIIHLGNRFLTWVTNTLYGCSIRDMTSCYKVMSRDLMNQLQLESKGFSLEAEITSKLFRLGCSIAELPISYTPRYTNKKLKIRDGWPILWTLLRIRFSPSFNKNTSLAPEVSKVVD